MGEDVSEKACLNSRKASKAMMFTRTPKDPVEILREPCLQRL